VAQHGPDLSQIGVELLNRSEEVHVPPKQPFNFANSQGQSLGGAETASTTLSQLPPQGTP
jgi:hypothetical protein